MGLKASTEDAHCVLALLRAFLSHGFGAGSIAWITSRTVLLHVLGLCVAFNQRLDVPSFVF